LYDIQKETVFKINCGAIHRTYLKENTYITSLEIQIKINYKFFTHCYNSKPSPEPSRHMPSCPILDTQLAVLKIEVAYNMHINWPPEN
jgi:hypothetical protein